MLSEYESWKCFLIFPLTKRSNKSCCLQDFDYGNKQLHLMKKKHSVIWSRRRKGVSSTEAVPVVQVLFLLFTHNIGKSDKRKHSVSKACPKIIVP